MEACIFCKIASHEAPAKIEHEDRDWMVFHDIHPSAPVHLLLVPKQHLLWQGDLTGKELVLGKVFQLAREVAEKLALKEGGFKLVMNAGRGAGQLIDHFHLHLIGGWPSGEERNLP